MGTIQPAAITPTGLNVQIRHTGSVKVQTSVLEHSVGEEETILDPQTLAAAITKSIEDTRVFAVVKQGSTDYLLEVRITGAEGHTGFTVGMKLRSVWRLTRLSDNKIVFTDFVEASKEATLGEAVNGFKRIRIASERATKELVKAGIESLGKAELR